jgi:glycosyltransferase involved in cell wall biosynthesis
MNGSPVSFSICIPNYNYARYIGQTIESVLAQSYPHFEIIVTDNHSTDDSPAVVRAFGDERIRLFINQYNVGFAPNLDRAASHAVHPYLIMLSADDLMRPGALAEYAAVIEALGTDAANVLIASNIEYFNDAGDVLHATTRRELMAIEPEAAATSAIGRAGVELFDGRKVFAHVFPRMKVATPFCSTAYSRELYERIGGYGSVHHTAPDAHFTYKAMLAGANIVFVDRPLFGYRIHGSNQLQLSRHDKNLKVPIDHYIFARQFPEAELARAGVKRAEAIEALVDETCLNGALIEVRDGDRGQAFRMLMFAMATSPSHTLRNLKTYLLLILMIPLAGRPMSRALYAIRRRMAKAAA